MTVSTPIVLDLGLAQYEPVCEAMRVFTRTRTPETPDEIWFVERGDDHASTIYPLTKFKARFDKDIHKDYLLGRYGALPIFGKMKRTAHRER